MRDDFDVRREERVAADVIVVRMRIEDVRDGLVRHAPHGVEQTLAAVRAFRVDQHHSVGADEDGRVAAVAFDYEKIVAQSLDRQFLTEPAMTIATSRSRASIRGEAGSRSTDTSADGASVGFIDRNEVCTPSL